MNSYSINFSKIIRLSLILLLTVTAFGLIKHVKANGGNSSRELVCDSIRIEANDTLWSIASEYYTYDYDDIEDYILAIKKANNLSGDTIHAGNYLIIPYYID